MSAWDYGFRKPVIAAGRAPTKGGFDGGAICASETITTAVSGTGIETTTYGTLRTMISSPDVSIRNWGSAYMPNLTITFTLTGSVKLVQGALWLEFHDATSANMALCMVKDNVTSNNAQTGIDFAIRNPTGLPVQYQGGKLTSTGSATYTKLRACVKTISNGIGNLGVNFNVSGGAIAVRLWTA